ncbi:MAG: hypothetical protein II921_04060 [Treponema sp.]|nr:hypothetical protein [Treponema sp.]
MAKTIRNAELELFRNRPVRNKRLCYVDGRVLFAPPQLSPKEKLLKASIELGRFWNTPLRNFWRSVYIRYRDEYRAEQKKGGSQDAPSEPPTNNHDDGKPAA